MPQENLKLELHQYIEKKVNETRLLVSRKNEVMRYLKKKIDLFLKPYTNENDCRREGEES